MKRIFVGIPISDELQEKILLFSKQQQSLPVRWLKGKNLHITLAPPWRTWDWKEIYEKLKAIKQEPFKIVFDKISFGPNPKEPRLIWVSGKAPKQIYDLRYKIYEIIEQELDNKQLIMHSTLARFRPGDFKNFPVKELNEDINWQMDVDSFVLYQSRMLPQAAEYEILERIVIRE